MQADKAAKLREQWKAAGDKPCKHEKTEKEYDLGADTGDRVCSACGKTV